MVVRIFCVFLFFLTFQANAALHSSAVSDDYRINDALIEVAFAKAQNIPISDVMTDFIQPHTVVEGTKSKVAAGVLGIVLGSYGIHRFYLGHTTAGILYLVTSFCGGTIGCLLTLPIGGIGVVLGYVPGVVGLVDGIMYLVATDSEFETKYVQNKKLIQW